MSNCHIALCYMGVGGANVTCHNFQSPLLHHMAAQLTGMANILHYNSNSTLIENAKKESKLQNFLETLGDLGPNEFLYLVKSRESRSFISKIRTGVLDLSVETGRRKNVPRELRICTQCNNNLVEDELHFMFDCSAYTLERHNFIRTCSEQMSNINNMSSKEKYISIMNSSNDTILTMFGVYSNTKKPPEQSLFILNLPKLMLSRKNSLSLQNSFLYKIYVCLNVQ